MVAPRRPARRRALALVQHRVQLGAGRSLVILPSDSGGVIVWFYVGRAFAWCWDRPVGQA